jgi:hypothetical protein
MGGPAAALRAEQHRCTAVAHQDKCGRRSVFLSGCSPSIQSSRNSKLMAAAPATVLLAVGNAAALVVLVLLLGGGSPHRPFLAQPTADRRCPAVQVGLRFGVF